MKELRINVPDGYEIDKDKSTFENIVFKKKNELPKSFIDLGEIGGNYIGNFSPTLKDTNYAFPVALMWKKKKQVKAAIALAKLSHLRDVYRQGWEPDWGYGEVKYCIIFNRNDAIVYERTYDNNFLSFQDEETANLFLVNFRDLIEKAKPLMS